MRARTRLKEPLFVSRKESKGYGRGSAKEAEANSSAEIHLVCQGAPESIPNPEARPVHFRHRGSVSAARCRSTNHLREFGALAWRDLPSGPLLASGAMWHSGQDLRWLDWPIQLRDRKAVCEGVSGCIARLPTQKVVYIRPAHAARQEETVSWTDLMGEKGPRRGSGSSGEKRGVPIPLDTPDGKRKASDRTA